MGTHCNHSGTGARIQGILKEWHFHPLLGAPAVGLFCKCYRTSHSAYAEMGKNIKQNKTKKTAQQEKHNKEAQSPHPNTQNWGQTFSLNVVLLMMSEGIPCHRLLKTFRSSYELNRTVYNLLILASSPLLMPLRFI